MSPASGGAPCPESWLLLGAQSNVPRKLYFDTDSFHRFADAFGSRGLRADLRDRIVLSLVTIMEVLSQLTLKSGDEILKRIHSLLNLVNRERAEILPWMDFPIAKVGFGTKIEEDTTERLGRRPDVLTQVPLWFTGPGPGSRVIGTVDVAGLRSGPRLPRKVGPAGPLVEPSKMSEGYPPFRLSGPERVRQLFP